MTVHTAPFGTWKSPVTAQMLTTSGVGFGEVHSTANAVYWMEGRPLEKGRGVVVRLPLQDGGYGKKEDVTPSDMNARTMVHEYGGGAYTVHTGQDGKDVVYFANFADQMWYSVVVGSGEAPQPVTKAPGMRFADAVVDKKHNQLICVREDHTLEGREAENSLVAVKLDGSGEMQVLASGFDFYSSPALSPSSDKLAWLSWNHPNMPWDGTELWVADVDSDGKAINSRRLVGGATESIFQPQWAAADDSLIFVSDRTGWWNLYTIAVSGGEPIALVPRDAEFGVPQWVFGQSTYAVLSSSELVAAYTKDGLWHLGKLNLGTREFKELQIPYSAIGSVRAGQKGSILFLGASSKLPGEVVELNPSTGEHKVLQTSGAVPISESYISVAEPIAFPSTDGRTAYALFYPPVNPEYSAPLGEHPPLIVMSHGGPTGATSSAFSLRIQYWTTRGFAVADVNYGGSTGYGRSFRDSLKGTWGIVDVDDCTNAALYLARQGKADEQRLAIRGGSAGGYTTLASLAFRDAFKAGASYFGVSDIELLAKETHKFESRYMESLIGPYPAAKAIFEERSPLHHTDDVNCPLIFFQGLDDKIVPPNQAELMFEKLKARGIPVAYIAFEGEGHGFRRSENIIRSTEAECWFYAKVFGFTLADDVTPVEVFNL